ncbi:ferritin [Helicobacter sp. MIT 14-3879]|uniref:ferritin n=1 Tax=Helicobacter sp. MIT 14-3879 TaxID=2040649 RepID=UPI000E1F8F3F|nr:ferritin [Helicobacter sp. MIT 14-3879]RDU65008.1 ferritin [Helicobacter sp. MIT 14-3879]
MLSNEVIDLLNDQVAKEMFAANLYLSMSGWCFKNRFDGAGEFLSQHAEEESGHAKKLITYLNETDSQVMIQSIEKPESNFSSLLDVFEKTYKHEISVTQSINNLVDFTFNKKDYSTFNFLQWYVSEQHEEESLFRGIVDKIKLIGDQSHGLYLADQYIKTLINK